MSPAPIARNSVPISLALPGADRNLTRLNAPATATPTPTFPLTIMMTTQMTAGSIARVARKLFELFPPFRPHRDATKARKTPMRSETRTQRRKSPTPMTFVDEVSNSPANKLDI